MHNKIYTIFSTKNGILLTIKINKQYTPNIITENWLIKFFKDWIKDVDSSVFISGMSS
jgi:hypothetical protein